MATCEVCEQCGQEIDESKEGFGHRRGCGGYTFRVNPEVMSFIRANPKATSEELARGWIDKILKREEEGE